MRKLGIDLVPVHEEHTARIERGLTIDQWLGMAELEKALIIAQRRIAKQMENLHTEAEVRKMKQEAKKNARN